MTVDCDACPLRKRACFDPMSDAELSFMKKFKVGELVVEPGTQILLEGSNSPQLFTALHGMGLRYKIGEQGARQVVNFVMPGDFVGLQAGVMKEMGHSVEATTAMTLCVFDRKELWTLFRNNPERGFDLAWLAAVEENFLGDALFAVGRRSATARVSWALLRLFIRLSSLGLVRGNSVRLPYKQQDLADALGLSLVHTNKTLAKLRDRQLAQWSDGRLSVASREELATVANVSLDEVTPPVRPLI